VGDIVVGDIVTLTNHNVTSVFLLLFQNIFLFRCTRVTLWLVNVTNHNVVQVLSHLRSFFTYGWNNLSLISTPKILSILNYKPTLLITPPMLLNTTTSSHIIFFWQWYQRCVQSFTGRSKIWPNITNYIFVKLSILQHELYYPTKLENPVYTKGVHVATRPDSVWVQIQNWEAREEFR